MKLAKVRLADGSRRVAIVENDSLQLLDFTQLENVRTLADVLHAKDPANLAKFLADPQATPIPESAAAYVAPIDFQEVWAAGVTYKRSQIARMEESKSGASHYDKVYSAPRPELFFKASPNRVSGPGEPVRVRADSDWSVPEPEFTLVLSPDMRIVGYTIGNDMSARDIEGENPLYLPQAKVYRQCCALGPVIRLATEPLDLAATTIELKIRRKGNTAFQGSTSLAQLNRELPDIAGWLAKEDEFPNGAFLLTGTGIVPPDDFTLEDGDEASISIAGIGTLTNPVVKGPRST
ncbi:MAG: fumarylacetoacetate hydrolase family protein [Planctomyces sp.]|nr:fumarylacetoacetate hydrolase family protein [Planctomyces sp.]